MKLVVGLGNPGKEYERTRHNVGFMVADELSRRMGEPGWKAKFRGLLADGRLGDDRVQLLKPLTYMNVSGQAVSEAVRWFKLDADDVLIVADDLDRPFATLRMRQRGSAGGHNGLASIFQSLGTNDIVRLKIGIGRGRGGAHAHVLGRFDRAEEQELPLLIAEAADAVESWISEGVLVTMNTINAKSTPHPTAGTAGPA